MIVSLGASFSPRRVPRHRLAPVSISFSGRLSTDDGSPLPRLRGIELALASGSSRLDTVGWRMVIENALDISHALLGGSPDECFIKAVAEEYSGQHTENWECAS